MGWFGDSVGRGGGFDDDEGFGLCVGVGLLLGPAVVMLLLVVELETLAMGLAFVSRESESRVLLRAAERRFALLLARF